MSERVYRFLALAVFAACTVIMPGGAARSQQVRREETVAPATSTAVLDTLSVWRIHSELAPPVLVSGKTVSLSCAWMRHKTPGPPVDWMTPDFDDRFWGRGPLTMVPRTALLSRVCLRGKFTVTDPGAVKGLKLSVTYQGGIIVYVNGKEVGREHIAAGSSLAEGPGGAERELKGLAIANTRLRKGSNVIALEIVRAAYPEEGVETGQDVYNVNCCQVTSARLSASGGTGLIANVDRPDGLQVWPVDAMALDMSLDWGNPAEGVRPVTIIGARNGSFGGKVLVGSRSPIRGLKVTAGELKGTGGIIPASHVRIRYGMAWGEQEARENTRLNQLHPYAAYEATQYNALSPVPPSEVGVAGLRRAWYRGVEVPETVKPIPGAVVPVWLTVKVPAEVKGGTYRGSVVLSAAGEKAVRVPVEVRVSDWQVPDTQDYRTWMDVIQCPDTLAMEYEVGLWSEKHWDLISESFKLIGETGSRTVYVPLIAHTNLGNEESMVRWAKRADGKYDYDFSTMERYLDVAEKAMGKPKLIVFVVWDVYMLPKSSLENPHGNAFRIRSHLAHLKKIGGEYGIGPIVTVVDKKQGTRENAVLPTHFETEASRRLWQPLFDELGKRLAKRKMEKISMLGLFHDTWATQEEVTFFKELTDGMPWVIQSHGGPAEGKQMYGITPIGYQAVVWKVRFSDDGADTHGKGKGITSSLHGWNRKVLWSQFDRFTRERHPNTRWRRQAEVCITGAQRGYGRLGGDVWKVIRDKRGRRVGRSYERYPESSWRNLAIPEAVLAPGPRGPVATNHFEALREGVQECEARIVIERALMDEKLKAKLGADLAKRCEEHLQARHMMMWLSLSNLQFYQRRPGSSRSWETYTLARNWRNQPNVTGHHWFLSSCYQERTAELFDLAGEVERATRGR